MSDIRNLIMCSNPPAELNTIIKSKSITKLNLYIDLKNAAVGLFIPNVVQEICENSQSMQNGMDSTILQSILYTISKWKQWAYNLKIDINIFLCSDQGRSNYHKNIIKEYKSNRRITNHTLALYEEAINKIKEKNFNLAEEICNRIHNVYFLSLNFIEGDFIPHYLISRYFKDEQNTLHVLASNDKDHHQTLCLENTMMFSKKTKEKRFWEKNNILLYFTDYHKETDPVKKTNILSQITNIEPEYTSLLLSFCGDSCDNVPGVKGIGPKKVVQMFSNKENVKKYIGENIEEVINRVSSGGYVIKDSEDFKPNIENINIKKKKTKTKEEREFDLWKLAYDNNEILTNAFKVINYELLCNWLEEADNLTKMKNINYIKDKINKTDIDIISSQNDINKFINLTKSLPDIQLSDVELQCLFL
jgi:5'-3' exonuclease